MYYESFIMHNGPQHCCCKNCRGAGAENTGHLLSYQRGIGQGIWVKLVKLGHFTLEVLMNPSPCDFPGCD